MKLNEDSKCLLIENPLCGNTSFSKGLKLSDHPDLKKWSLPKECRSVLGEETWRSYTKYVLVREPIQRFLSGCVWSVLVDRDIHRSWGADEDYIDFVEDLKSKDVLATKRTQEFLRYLITKNFDGVPTWLHPQKLWLSAKFDIVIATHNIAEYFNNNFKNVSVRRENLLASDPGRDKQFLVPPEISHLVRELYPEDFNLFEKLLVWCPSEERVRLITGYCRTCELGIKNNTFTPINLQDYKDPLDAKPKTKAKKKSK